MKLKKSIISGIALTIAMAFVDAGTLKGHVKYDGKPPQAFGIFNEDRLMVLYTYECDLGDGWEDKNVHNDPEHIRLEALKMGANIVIYNLIQ